MRTKFIHSIRCPALPRPHQDLPNGYARCTCGAAPESARYWGYDPETGRWDYLVLTDGWIDLYGYLEDIREWAQDVGKHYTCFAITVWTRAQQDRLEAMAGSMGLTPVQYIERYCPVPE